MNPRPTLTLTTPLTHGAAVRVAQELLLHNRFGDFLGHPQDVDGVYGPQTARATHRAKFWLGYPAADIDGAFGDTLHHLLAGTPLPGANQKRRADRVAASQRVPMRLAAIRSLIPHLGLTEQPPGSNVCLFSQWYGLIGPWCAMTVTWAYVQAGSKAFVRGHRYAFVPYMEHDARYGLNNLARTHSPVEGDVVTFDWNRDGAGDHTGLFERWVIPGRTFMSIEGNTGIGNDSNGGELMRRERNVADVNLFIHVGA